MPQFEQDFTSDRVCTQGLRLFVVSNDSSQLSPMPANVEHWAVYGSDNPVRSYSDTASQNALGPFLAYSSLGPSFKWAFFGTLNTHTAFFPEAAAEAVRGLDPELPYFLTGILSLSSQSDDGRKGARCSRLINLLIVRVIMDAVASVAQSKRFKVFYSF